MGGTISQAANGLGNAVGNALSAPFKSVFGGTCEGVCAGPFDVVCFIEHICVVNLLKLFVICFLLYITLLFLYLLFKLGVFQCVIRSLCRCCWTACGTYWSVLGHVLGALWHKLVNTKRVYRGRRSSLAHNSHGGYIRNEESGYLSADRKRKFIEDMRDGHRLVRRQRSNQHRLHHSNHHCHHHSDIDTETKWVTTRLQRSRSSWDGHIHRHHMGTSGEVDKRLSFKRQRVER